MPEVIYDSYTMLKIACASNIIIEAIMFIISMCMLYVLWHKLYYMPKKLMREMSNKISTAMYILLILYLCSFILNIAMYFKF